MSSRLPLKISAWAIALTLVALPIIGVLNGWIAADRWPVRYVQVQAPFAHVSAEQIRAASASQLGTGFFALQLEDVRKAVAALPWVASVEARKRWPDTLVLEVRERQPFARWGQSRLIDRNGDLFDIPGGSQLQGLPVLDGPDDALADVVAFFKEAQQTLSGTGLILTGVVQDARGSWTLNLNGGGAILLGHHDIEARLQRFLAAYPQLSPTHSAGFDRVDLRYTNGFAVQWAAPAVAPASPAATPASDAPTDAKAHS
ncbi:MAG TPA: cell division protein FtsQ/DivIB [Rudaea sp.]|nr:cell division protein FtsQ/DivIB [Rudaea sp.]